ncbi:hypothetical protein ID866_6211 [Astraeus odoratus]|nr:hypothetical protein ID866_6211 [Astraeus odoratus]
MMRIMVTIMMMMTIWMKLPMCYKHWGMLLKTLLVPPGMMKTLVHLLARQECMNKTCLTVLTLRSCTPSWCKSPLLHYTSSAWHWNGLSQTFYLLETWKIIPSRWMIGESLSLNFNPYLIHITWSLMRINLTTFK